MRNGPNGPPYEGQLHTQLHDEWSQRLHSGTMSGASGHRVVFRAVPAATQLHDERGQRPHSRITSVASGPTVA